MTSRDNFPGDFSINTSSANSTHPQQNPNGYYQRQHGMLVRFSNHEDIPPRDRILHQHPLAQDHREQRADRDYPNARDHYHGRFEDRRNPIDEFSKSDPRSRQYNQGGSWQPPVEYATELRQARSPSQFLSGQRSRQKVELSHDDRQYAIPNVRVEVSRECHVFDYVSSLIIEKSNSAYRGNKDYSPEYRAELTKMIGKNAEVNWLKQLPIDYINEYCNASAQFFTEKVRALERDQNQLTRLTSAIERIRKRVLDEIAPRMKKFRVIYAKSLNNISKFRAPFGDFDQDPSEMGYVFLSDAEENELAQAWNDVSTCLSRAFQPLIDWCNSQRLVEDQYQKLLDQSNHETEQQLKKKIVGLKYENQTEFGLFYCPGRVALSIVLKSLEPNSVMESIIVKVYFAYLQQVHGVSQSSEVMVKGIEDTQEFFKDVKAYYNTRRQKLFSVYNTVALMIQHKTGQNASSNTAGMIGDYALVVYHCRPHPTRKGKLRQIIVYDPTGKRLDYYHQFRWRVQTHLDLETGDFGKEYVEENLIMKEANPIKPVDSYSTGLYLLYNISNIALRGVPERLRLEMTPELMELIRNNLKIFIKYLAYCSTDQEPRYPNTDWLEFCTKQLIPPQEY